MRWQRIARAAIALFVIGFAIVVFLAMRPRPTTLSDANDVARADPEALFESGLSGLPYEADFLQLTDAVLGKVAVAVVITLAVLPLTDGEIVDLLRPSGGTTVSDAKLFGLAQPYIPCGKPHVL